MCQFAYESIYAYSCSLGNPPPGTHRTDIIQAVQLGSRKKLIRFCEQVQKKSPVVRTY